MSQNTYPVPEAIAAKAHINLEQYLSKYQESITHPDAFWRKEGQILSWIKPYTKVKNTSFAPGHIDIRWFEDGELNLAANCLDRHLATKAQAVAIIWEGDSPNESKTITYQALYDEVCRLANVLKQNGVQKGDVVAIYMPMVVEGAIAMLACARIGAVHSVIFGGFSPEAIAGRLIDSRTRLPCKRRALCAVHSSRAICIPKGL